MRRDAAPPAAIAAGLAAVFAAELEEQLRAALAAWSRAGAAATRAAACSELARIFHTLKGGAALAGRSELATAARQLERFFADPDAASVPDQTVLDALFAAAALPPPSLTTLAQALFEPAAGAQTPAATLLVPLAVGPYWLTLPLDALTRATAITTPEAGLPLVIDGTALPLVRLAELLGAPPPAPRAVVLHLRGGGALLVDRVRPPLPLIVEPLGRLLALHPWLAGTTVDPHGRALGVLDVERLRAAVPAAPHADQPAEGDGARVLVVDDSLVAREAAAAALRTAGLPFDLARDGREALVKLERGRYAVVLSDLEMPHLDGFSLVERLRSSERWRTQPVVVCSSRLDAAARARLAPLGVERFVDKPFVADELLAALRPWLPAPGSADF